MPRASGIEDQGTVTAARPEQFPSLVLMTMTFSLFQDFASAAEPVQEGVGLVGDLSTYSDSGRAFAKAIKVGKALC